MGSHRSVLSPQSSALAYLASFVDVERGDVPAGGMGLERIRQLLAALGQPQTRYPAVLIAGTKGKGSTAAMVERALRAAGYRTGLYTQPHLHTIRERVRVGGELMAPEALAAAMDRVRAVVEAGPRASTTPLPVTTAYEIMTALALDTFARANVDVAVLEVGLGGRLDATNVVDAGVSAITSISLDHTQILGDTVGAIAAEKADIIKPGRPCVSAPQPADAMAVIRQVAAARGARLRVAGEDGARWDADPRGGDLLTAQGRIADLRPALQGGFQRTNVAVAASILDALRESGLAAVSLDAVRTGIEQVAWPGRFEVVPGGPTMVLDGAHNVESAQRLREALAAAYDQTSLTLVLGIAADKDVPGMVAALCQPGAGPPHPDRLPRARGRGEPGQAGLDAVSERAPSIGAPGSGTQRVAHVIATRAAHPRAAEPAALAALARAAGVDATTAPTVAEALALARRLAGPAGLVVATGSLYVVAEAREALGLAQPSGEAAFNPWGAR